MPSVQYGHTPLSYSKGLFLQQKVQMYKHLEKVLFPEEESAHTSEATATSQGDTMHMVSSKPVRLHFDSL